MNVVDTLMIARKKFPGSPASLDALCKRFKVSSHSKRDKHGALIDVELLYEVYRHLLDENSLIKTGKAEEKISLQVEKHRPFREARIFDCSVEELADHQEFLKQIKNPMWMN